LSHQQASHQEAKMTSRGKKRKIVRGHQDDDDPKSLFESLERLALMINACRASRERVSFVTSVDLPALFSIKALANYRSLAKANLQTWKSGNMPFGAAKYFLGLSSDAELTALESLGINDIIKSTIDLHSTSCPNSCGSDSHSSSIITSGSSTECSSLSSSSNLTRNSDEIPVVESESAIEFQSAAGIPVDEVERLLSSSSAVQLSDSQVDALSGRSTALRDEPTYTIRRLSAHWSVRWGMSQAAMTDYCHLFKGHHPEVFNELPMTGKTLMKTPPMDHLKKFRPIHGDTIDPKTGEKIVVGEYMHLGIEEGVLGKSIGVIHWYEHAASLRRVHLVAPDLLPQQILDAVRPRDGDEFEESIRQNWEFDHLVEREPVTIEIHVNIDGVQWFNNSSVKGTPILGRIHAIRNSKSCVKIPKGKPFVIGVFKQAGKCSVQDFVADFITELRQLQVPTEDRPYSVKLVAMICDAPARCELKGIFL
jgi:hypothetical protein